MRTQSREVPAVTRSASVPHEVGVGMNNERKGMVKMQEKTGKGKDELLENKRNMIEDVVLKQAVSDPV
jgi:hypothetical protein